MPVDACLDMSNVSTYEHSQGGISSQHSVVDFEDPRRERKFHSGITLKGAITWPS